MTAYSLMYGDVLLGTLYPYNDIDIASPPLYRFEPTGAFQEFRPLFHAAFHLYDARLRYHAGEVESYDHAQLERVRAQLAALDLRVVPNDGGKAVSNYELHIIEDDAWLEIADTP